MTKGEIEKAYHSLCHQYSIGVITFDQLKVRIGHLEVMERSACGHEYKRNAYGEMICIKCGEEQ